MYIFLDYDGTLNLTDEKTFAKAYYNALFSHTGLDPEMYLDAINFSVEKIIKENDTSKNNFEKFLNHMETYTNKDRNEWKEKFMDFYKNGFDVVKKVMNPNTELINTIKNTDHKLIFASNPLFPKICVEKRIEMIDMKPEDFVYISYMENSYTTKPHKEYFENILKELNISPEKTIIIGDTDFDKAAEKVGIRFIHVENVEKWKEIIKTGN